MLKKKINGVWNGVTTLKKKVNGVWSYCSTAKKKISGAWSVVWQRVFLDWQLYSSGSSFSYWGAYSTANGAITMYGRYPSGNSMVRICTANQITLAPYETLYIDCSFSTSGMDPLYRLDAPWRSQSNLMYNTGTKSIQNTSSNAQTQSLYLDLEGYSYPGSDSEVTLTITKIYTDSAVYYWNTKTIK